MRRAITAVALVVALLAAALLPAALLAPAESSDPSAWRTALRVTSEVRH